MQKPRPAEPAPASSGPRAPGSETRRTATLGNGQVVELANMSERFTVRLIETVVVAGLVVAELVAMAIWFFVSGYWGSWSIGQASRTADRRTAVALAGVVLALTLLLPVIFETWRNCRDCREDRRGRGGIRLIRFADGEPPSALESATRALLPIGTSALAYCVALFIGPWNAAEAIVLVGVPMWLLTHGSALMRTDRRGWPDQLAGTIMIPTR